MHERVRENLLDTDMHAIVTMVAGRQVTGLLRLFYGCSYMFHLSGDNSRNPAHVISGQQGHGGGMFFWGFSPRTALVGVDSFEKILQTILINVVGIQDVRGHLPAGGPAVREGIHAKQRFLQIWSCVLDPDSVVRISCEKHTQKQQQGGGECARESVRARRAEMEFTRGVER